MKSFVRNTSVLIFQTKHHEIMKRILKTVTNLNFGRNAQEKITSDIKTSASPSLL